jgi:hypothetical protein
LKCAVTEVIFTLTHMVRHAHGEIKDAKLADHAPVKLPGIELRETVGE